MYFWAKIVRISIIKLFLAVRMTGYVLEYSSMTLATSTLNAIMGCIVTKVVDA